MTEPVPASQQGTPAAETQPACPPRIPDHESVRCIGSGSYGEVWLARTLTGSHRAVKVVHRRSFRDTGPFEREFSGIQKFEPISRSHDGFVDILQVGKNDQDGYFYYVMELADDLTRGQEIDPRNYAPKTLATEIRARGKLPIADCLALGLSLTAALDHLHKHKLVHRDIKPSNIVFVHSTPKLADIGLVTELGQRSFVGTDGYIPPEGPGTAQADLFALGKVLYEVSTGNDRLKYPELPSTSPEGKDVPGLRGLNEVILKACDNDPRARYQTGYEMHADLLLLQQGKPVPRAGASDRQRVLSLAAAAALVIALLLIWALARKGNELQRPSSAATLPSHVASLPAADVLKIAYGASPPPPLTTFERPRLSVKILAKRASDAAFVPLVDGEALASEKDDYKLTVQAFSSGYLYVFQVDSSGKKEWLFPQNDTSALSSGINPVQAGQSIQIPSPDAADSKPRALYLDQTAGYEHIYAVLSATQWPELEQALAQPGRAASAIVTQPNALQLRAVGGARVTDASEPVEAEGTVLVIERWFRHVAAQ